MILSSEAGAGAGAGEAGRALLARQDSRSRWEDGWMFPRRWMLPGLSPALTADTGATVNRAGANIGHPVI